MKYRLDEIRDWENKHSIVLKKIEYEFEKTHNRINLNIGGRLFCSTKEVFMSIENTFFYGLIANKSHFKEPDDGVFFIDRNPVVFDRILDYLRNGKINLKSLSKYEIDILKDDFEYYCLPTLLRWDDQNQAENISFSNENLTIRHVSGAPMDLDYSCSIGNITTDEFTVRLDSIGRNREIYIGFTVGGSSWEPTGDNIFPNTWLIDIDGEYCYQGSDVDVRMEEGSYCEQLEEGDHLTVIREDFSIRFLKNGKDLGKCEGLKNIPNQSLYPVVICDNNPGENQGDDVNELTLVEQYANSP